MSIHHRCPHDQYFGVRIQLASIRRQHLSGKGPFALFGWKSPADDIAHNLLPYHRRYPFFLGALQLYRGLHESLAMAGPCKNEQGSDHP